VSSTKPSPRRGLRSGRVRLTGAIFDTDGVITRTASVHFAAWKQVFDDVLVELDGSEATLFTDRDYRRYVDGIDRYAGVANFLASRGIEVPRGSGDDPPGHDTVCAIGNLKNEVFVDHLRERGVEAYPGTIRLIEQLRADGVGTAAISASRNCAAVLESADVAGLFDVRVDGVDAAGLGLADKPEPDVFLEAARRLSVGRAGAVVVEDAVAGVEAGRRGGFGVVVGVDRTRHAAELERFADIVVPDLADLEWSGVDLFRSATPSGPLWSLPSALDDSDLPRQIAGRRVAVVLDDDGTLAPITDRPEHAMLPDATRRALVALAELVPVGILSGRGVDDVRRLIGVDGLWYAGSHGVDVLSPDGHRQQFTACAHWDKGQALARVLAAATGQDTSVLPVYVGDDEDAFRAVRANGVAVVVGDDDRATAAHCRLVGPDEVGELLARITALVTVDE
jgi:HAD superfamily hydrolase (TIGR01509 family)